MKVHLLDLYETGKTQSPRIYCKSFLGTVLVYMDYHKFTLNKNRVTCKKCLKRMWITESLSGVRK